MMQGDEIKYKEVETFWEEIINNEEFNVRLNDSIYFSLVGNPFPIKIITDREKDLINKFNKYLNNYKCQNLPKHI